MAANAIPINSAQFIGLGSKMHNGLVLYAADLGIKQITADDFQTDLAAFIDADNQYNLARSATQSVSDAHQTQLDGLSGFLQKTRNVLAAAFGPRWSTIWAQAGFIDNSTQVPGRNQERIGLALSLAGFFGAHPNYEVASMGVTKQQAEFWRGNVLTAQQAYAAAQVTQKQKNDARDTAYETLASDMRTVIKTLSELLDPMDPRWLQFGLNMPGANVTPSQPINVAAVWHPPTSEIIVTCDAVALATRYRARTLRVGIESDYTLAGSGPLPQLAPTGYLPGQRVEITMQAVNGAAQSVPSVPVQIVVPVPPLKTQNEAVAPVTEAIVVPAETSLLNGSDVRNGHAELATTR